MTFAVPQKSVTRILVVEDEPAARFLLVHFLEEKGFGVVEAENAQEAMEALQRDPFIRLVFTDVRLPGMNGHALALWVREHYPDLPIVVGSGSALAPALAFKQSYSFFLKPYDFEALGKHIAALIAARQANPEL
jgi:DNA-binding NtrC family response regulator